MSHRDRDGSGYPFLDSDARKNLKKDMSGQPDPSGWKSHGKGIAQNNKKEY
jgi:hypothetical protein